MFHFIPFFLLACPVAALYSMHFVPGADHIKILGNHGRFLKSPEASHVADIYARLAGVSPILQEGALSYILLNLPSLSHFVGPVRCCEYAGSRDIFENGAACSC